MDGNELRAMQAPIKQRYKDDPDAAVITLKARGTLDDTSIAFICDPSVRSAVGNLSNGKRGSLTTT